MITYDYVSLLFMNTKPHFRWQKGSYSALCYITLLKYKMWEWVYSNRKQSKGILILFLSTLCLKMQLHVVNWTLHISLTQLLTHCDFDRPITKLSCLQFCQRVWLFHVCATALQVKTSKGHKNYKTFEQDNWPKFEQLQTERRAATFIFSGYEAAVLFCSHSHST